MKKNILKLILGVCLLSPSFWQAHAMMSGIARARAAAANRTARVYRNNTRIAAPRIPHVQSAQYSTPIHTQPIQQPSAESINQHNQVQQTSTEVNSAEEVWHNSVPFTWIKGLHAIAKREELSIVNGMLWWEQGIIKNLYQTGHQQDATIQLIRELFYLEHDGFTFRPTMYDSKVGALFTPEMIGAIIAATVNYRDTVNKRAHDDNDAEKRLYQTLVSLIDKRLSATQELLEAEVSPLYKKLEIVAAKERTLQTELTILNTQIKSIKKQLHKTCDDNGALLAQQEILIAQKKVQAEQFRTIEKEKEELKKQIAQQVEQLKTDDCSKQKVVRLASLKSAAENSKKLSQLIVDSVKETCQKNSPYVTFATEQVLLAFLWSKTKQHKKSTSLEKDIVAFFNQLPDTLVDRSKLIAWLSSHSYSKQEYDNFVNELNRKNHLGNLNYIDNNHEQLAFFTSTHKAIQKVVSPTAHIRSYYKHPTVKTAEFLDCAETMLRNFFNIILYNQEKGILDIDKFIKHAHNDSGDIKLDIDKKFIDFYKNNFELDGRRANKTHNEWNNVIQNLPDIVYVQSRTAMKDDDHEVQYEIKSSLSNILNVINYLVFGNSAQFKMLSNKEKLDLICKKVLSNNFTDFAWSSDDEVNTSHTVQIKFSADSDSFNWNVSRHHSYLKVAESSADALLDYINTCAVHELSRNETTETCYNQLYPFIRTLSCNERASIFTSSYSFTNPPSESATKELIHCIKECEDKDLIYLLFHAVFYGRNDTMLRAFEDKNVRDKLYCALDKKLLRNLLRIEARDGIAIKIAEEHPDIMKKYQQWIKEIGYYECQRTNPNLINYLIAHGAHVNSFRGFFANCVGFVLSLLSKVT